MAPATSLFFFFRSGIGFFMATVTLLMKCVGFFRQIDAFKISGVMAFKAFLGGRRVIFRVYMAFTACDGGRVITLRMMVAVSA